MTTLPKEIEEEFERICESNEFDCPIGGNALVNFIAKVYQTARRQALTEGIEAMPEVVDNKMRFAAVYEAIKQDGYWEGKVAYRAEAIAKLTRLRDV